MKRAPAKAEHVETSLPARMRRTPEELAEAKRVREDRAKVRRIEAEALEAVCPSLALEGEEVRRVRPRRLAPDVSVDGSLLRLDRPSGTGSPGSTLVVVARDYDGLGLGGGEPRRYVSAFVLFRDGAGCLVRTQGVAVHESELRPLAGVLLAEAARIEEAARPHRPHLSQPFRQTSKPPQGAKAVTRARARGDSSA